MLRNGVGILDKICFEIEWCWRLKESKTETERKNTQMFKLKTFEQIYACEMKYVGIIVRLFIKGVNFYVQVLCWDPWTCCESIMSVLRKESNRSFIQPRRVTPDPLKSAYSSPSQACREVLADWSSKITCRQIMHSQGANICQNPCWNLHLREKLKNNVHWGQISGDLEISWKENTILFYTSILYGYIYIYVCMYTVNVLLYT